jgi:hypothetical protein
MSIAEWDNLDPWRKLIFINFISERLKKENREAEKLKK